MRLRFILFSVIFILASCASKHDVAVKRNREYNLRVKLAFSYIGSGEYKKALIEAYKAKRIRETPEVYNIIGLAHFGLKELDSAILSFKKALKLDPNFSEAWSNMSAVYIAKGNWKEAIICARKALRNKYYESPEVALTNMGVAYMELGRFSKAEKSFLKAIRYNAYYIPAYEKLIGLYITSEKYDKARDILYDAVSLQLDSPGIRFYRALFSLKDGDKEKALSLFESILSDFPLTVWAKKAKKYIEVLR